MSATARIEAHQGRDGDWEVVIGLEVHAQVTSQRQAVLRRLDRIRRRAQHPCLAGRRGHARHAAGHQPRMRRAGGAHRPRRSRRRSTSARSSTARTTSIPICRRAIRSRSTRTRSSARARSRSISTPEHSIRVGIERLHLEQDAGKSLHDQSPTMSFVDLNRSGVALMEIVSKPDMRSADEAKAYVSKLRTILRYLGSCDGDMEKGNLRADVNVSVRRPGEPLGTRCEIKNVNSIRFIGQAIEVEARRQIAVIEDGGTIEQETRLFDPVARRDALDALEGGGARLPLFPRSRPAAARTRRRPGSTRSPPICPNCPTPRRRASSPTTGSRPTTRRCSSPTARPPISSRRRSSTAARRATPRRSPTGSWAICRASANAQDCRSPRPDSAAARSATLVDLIGEGVISGKIAKDLLAMLLGPDKGADPRALVEARGLRQVTDAGAIERAVDAVDRRQSRQGRAGEGASPACSAGSSDR